MTIHATSIDLLAGRRKDSNATLRMLNEDLIPPAVKLLNDTTLPIQMPIFPDDVIPNNQRKLADVRTRIGTLLEYQFATAVNETLPMAVTKAGIGLTHVVANQFPDLAFRSQAGELGIRLEMKAVQAIAEEKAANFDALIKDIYKDKDFVVTFTWEWEKAADRDMIYPHIHQFYVMDAYQLALLRDTYWLDTPPRKHPGSGRQGFDLRFAINASGGVFNQEEGNLGKLMRIFDPSKEDMLSKDLLEGETLRTYYRFKGETRRLGMSKIFREVIAECTYADESIINSGMPMTWLITDGEHRLALLGDEKMPREKDVRHVMEELKAANIIAMNKDFSWNAYVAGTKGKADSGKKPAPAAAWAKEKWHSITTRRPL